MRDGPVRSFIKTTLARAYLKGLARRRRRQPPLWELAGECGGCARCCEAPAISVGLLFYVPVVRQLWLWWQRVVNGFVFVSADRQLLAFSFRCTHFDVVTRRCDSYESRPGMCHDYPRLLMEQPQPELFDGCGYRPVSPQGESMLRALQSAGVEGDQLVQITKKLRLK